MTWRQWFYTPGERRILKGLRRMSEQMNEVVADLTEKINKVDAKVDETAVTLGEIRAKLDAAVEAEDFTAVKEQVARLDGVLAKLTAAEDAADITPDEPVPTEPTPEA